MGVHQTWEDDPVASVENLRIGNVADPADRRDLIVLDEQVAANGRRAGHHRDEPTIPQQNPSAHRLILALPAAMTCRWQDARA